MSQKCGNGVGLALQTTAHCRFFNGSPLSKGTVYS